MNRDEFKLLYRACRERGFAYVLVEQHMKGSSDGIQVVTSLQDLHRKCDRLRARALQKSHSLTTVFEQTSQNLSLIKFLKARPQ